MTLFAQLSLANAGGVPTFDGVDVGVNLKNFAELTKTVQKLKQQYEKQIQQYKNQFGDTFGILGQIEELELYQTDFGYIPKDPQKAVELLMTLGNSGNPELIEPVNNVLNDIKNLNIQDAYSKAKHMANSSKVGEDLKLYLIQMKAAQDRIIEAKKLTENIGNAETQKEREALMVQMNVENYRANSEIANIIATKNAKDAIKQLSEEHEKAMRKQDWDEFINGGEVKPFRK